MIEMNKEIRSQWTTALRSGEYDQATGYLHVKDGGFCCLGVLSDLAVKAGVIPEPVLIEDEGVYKYDSETYSVLPKAVAKWAGIAGEDNDLPMAQKDDEEFDLAFMNDHGSDFSEIADLIDG